MGLGQSTNEPTRPSRMPLNPDQLEAILLFGVTLAADPRLEAQSSAVPRRWLSISSHASPRDAIPSPTAELSEAHARDQIRCAVCSREFALFFGVRNRRWCGACGQPVCLRCVPRAGALTLHVTCAACVGNRTTEDASRNNSRTDIGAPPVEDPSCPLCRQPFSFFRPKRRCRRCQALLCAVCTVVPFARRGAYDEEATCPQCAYGIDTAARPHGVNEEVLACAICGAAFGMFVRRHWCRRCGETICRQCSPATLFLTARRHPNCICKRCHVPPVFRLAPQLAQHCMSFLDHKSQDRCLRTCTHFQQLVELPFPLVGSVDEHYAVNRLDGLLGTGAFGRVYRAVCRQTGEVYAIKVIPKRRIFSLKQWSVAMREIDIQSAVDHPNSIRLYQVLQTSAEVFLIMELGTGCDIAQFCSRNRRLSEAQVALLAYQLLQFLRHVHALSVVHRDLKPDNILLSKDLAVAKVTDFGLAKFIEPPNPASTDPQGAAISLADSSPKSLDLRTHWTPSLAFSLTSSPQVFPRGPGGGASPSLTGSPLAPWRASSEGPPRGILGTSPLNSSSSILGVAGQLPPPPPAGRPGMRVYCTPCGTLPFCAPEVLAPGAYRKKHPYRRVFKRDMYSLGAVLHLLLCGKLPYAGSTVEALLQQMQQPLSLEGPKWALVSRQAKDFCTRLLALNPDERMSAEEALQHEWVAGPARWCSSQDLLLTRKRPPASDPPSPLSGPPSASTATFGDPDPP